MKQITKEILKNSDTFEYVPIYTQGHRNMDNSIFFDIQNNLIDRHGRGFTSILPMPTSLYRTENKTEPLVAKSMKVHEFEDDEIYILADNSAPVPSYTYYLKQERFFEMIDSIYEKYIDGSYTNLYFYGLNFSTVARDRDIDLTDFEDVSKIPKIHNLILRGARRKF